MHEIKFRIPMFWCKDGYFSHFMYWGRINHKGEYIYDGSCFISPGSSNKCHSGDDEQYIGRRDKKGKEIYEGDKLHVFLDGYDGNVDSVIGPVVWNSGEFGIQYKSIWRNAVIDTFFPLCEIMKTQDEVEIVGHIHENTSLKLGRD